MFSPPAVLELRDKMSQLRKADKPEPEKGEDGWRKKSKREDTFIGNMQDIDKTLVAKNTVIRFSLHPAFSREAESIIIPMPIRRKKPGAQMCVTNRVQNQDASW